MTDELTELYLDLLDFIEPLRTRLEQRDAVEYLFYRYGWDATMDDAAFARFRQAATIIAPIEAFAQTAEPLRAKLDGGGSLHAADVATLAGSAGVLIKALAEFGMPDLDGLADPLGRPEFWESIAEQVFDDLLERYLRVYQPIVFLVLRTWNVIRYDPTDATDPGRVPHTRVWFDWHQAAAMLTDPLQALERAYHWGDATQPFDYAGALEALRLAFTALRVPAALFSPALVTTPIPGDASRSAPVDVLALRATLLERDFPDENAFYRVGLEVYPAVRPTDQTPAGLMLKPILEGGAGATPPLNSFLTFRLGSTASAGDAIGFALFPGNASVVGGAPALGASLELATTDGAGPWYALGGAGRSRLEIAGFSAKGSLEGSVDDPELKLHLAFAGQSGRPGCKIVIALADADEFVQGTVDASQLELTFSPEVVWSSKSGLTFNGSPKLDFEVPLSVAVGPVTVTAATIAVGTAPQQTSADGVVVTVGVRVRGSLGPVTFVLDRLGFVCTITPYTRDDVRALPPGAPAPTLGSVDLDLQFAPPTLVGIAVDAGVVSGGGFLKHQGDEYAGALDLSFGKVALKAYGLVQTARSGYSFVGIISTEFSPPVELPFGFSLDGVGGLLGVNRTVAVDAVRAAVWGHHLDGLLFPKDPVASAPQLVSALEAYFPAAPGRYVLGPLAKIGWSADVVVGEVALLLELPEPLRLLLVGEIEVGVPAEEPQLELHVSFDGGVDFGKKLAFFDASLHDSRIESYPISGDLAFRYDWGDQPVFALALGGFNPHFQPPAAFPVLKRLAISISSSVAQIEAQAYLALTSNTLQFGARIELTAGGSFNVHGWLGFDALCERHPLYFEFDLSAGVELRHGTDVLASVHLDGHLSGPTPWHIKGKASLSLFFFDVTVDFDRTWGSDAGALPVADPLTALLAALADRSSWSGALPPGARAVVSPVGSPPDADSALLLDPAATLLVAQRALPLGQPLTRFGGSPLGRTVQLAVDGVSVFGGSLTPGDATTEEFAPAQYFDLTDAEKLSLPSFSRLDAGVEVGRAAVDLGRSERTRAVVTPLVYDTTILDSVKPPLGSEYRPDHLTVLALNGSVDGGGGLGRYAPPPGTPPLVVLAPDRWVVAGTADLGVRAEIESDGSKLGARLALARHLAANPGQSGQLQVVLADEAAV